MGFAELVARLERDADARVAAIESRARADVDAALAEGARSASATRERALAARRDARRARLALELAEARRRARADELRALHGVVDRVMQRAGELLDRIDRDSDPASLAALPAQIAAALRYVSGVDAVVRCRPSLAPLVRAAVAGHDARLAVEEAADMPVGVAIRAQDGSVEVDDTLPARLARMRRRLAVDVAARVVR